MIKLRDGSNNLRNKIKIDSKFRTLGANTIIFAIGNVFSKLILFFLMPLYTSAMSPTEYGFAELMNNGIDLLMPLATLCLYEAVFRFSIDVSLIKKKEILSSSLKIILIINTLVLSISILLLFLLDSLYPILFSFMLFAYSIRQLFAQFSRGIGKARFFAMSGILNAIILGISNVVLVGLLSYGVNGYLFSIALGNVSSAFYLYFRANIKQFIDLKILDKTLIKELLNFSIPMIPNSISWWFANISTRYILVMFQGIAVAGIFTAISKLPSIINVLSSIFQQAWQFSASKEISNKQASNFFTKVFLAYYSLIIASCSLIITFIPFISKFLLQGEFFEAWNLIPLLLVSAVLNCFSVYFGSIYTASMNNKMIMISTMVGACISVVSSFVLIPFIGIIGAIISTNLSYIVINLMRYFDTKKYIKLKINPFEVLGSISILYLQAFLYLSFGLNSFFYVLVINVVLLLIIIILYLKGYKKTNV